MNLSDQSLNFWDDLNPVWFINRSYWQFANGYNNLGPRYSGGDITYSTFKIYDIGLTSGQVAAAFAAESPNFGY